MPADLKERFGCHDFLALQKPTLDQFPPAFDSKVDLVLGAMICLSENIISVTVTNEGL